MEKGRKTILFISYDGLTHSLGQSQILPYLEGLASKGNSINILSCDDTNQYKKNKALVEKKVKKAHIDWYSVRYENKYPVFSPMLNARRIKKKATAIVRKKKIDIVHCRSIIPAQIGYELAQKFNLKFIFDIRGFWADERVDGKIWNLNNPIYRYLYYYFKRKESLLLKEADAVITLTENAKSYIKDNFNTKDNFGVIPCCVDFNHFDYTKIKQEKVNQLRSQIGIPEENYVLIYIGSLGARYQLVEMLNFFKILKQKESKASFLFVSKSDTSTIKMEASRMGIDESSIYLSECEYEDIPTFISIGDASIFFIVTSFSGKAVSPTKQAEVMSLGLPIIANSGLGDTDEILNSTDSGVVVSDYKEKTLEVAAEKLLAHKKSKQEIRATALQYFTLEAGVNRYHSIYKNL